jgi:hypothetical protein
MRKLLSDLFGWKATLQSVVYSIIFTGLTRLWLWLADVHLTPRREAAFWVLGMLTVACLFGLSSFFLRESERPKFIIDLMHISWVERDPGAPTGLILVVEIVNRGAPSAAKMWRLWIQPPAARPIRARSLSVPRPLPLPTSENVFRVITSNEWLYNKTATPIARGGMAVGILLFDITLNKELINQPGTQFILSCDDVYGRPFSLTRSVDALAPLPALTDLSWPGLESHIEVRNERGEVIPQPITAKRESI